MVRLTAEEEKITCRTCGKWRQDMTYVWKLDDRGRYQRSYAVCTTCGPRASVQVMIARAEGACPRCQWQWSRHQRYAITAEGNEICLRCAGIPWS